MVGVCWDLDVPRAIYDIDKCLEILKSQGMAPDEAREYFNFNTLGSNVGAGTPLYADIFEDSDEPLPDAVSENLAGDIDLAP